MGLLSAYTDGDGVFNPDEGENPFVLDPANNPAAGPPPVPGGGNGPVPGAPQYAPPLPGPGGGGNGGGGHGFGGGGSDVSSFPVYDFKRVPLFDAPAFVRPDAKSILNAPGYQARLQAGEQALQRSAASKGLLRTGGTLKDLIEYGQNFASNEYNNEFQQALQTFGANHQLAKDKYAPLLAEWDLLSKAEIQKALAAYNRGTVWNAPRGGGGGGSYMEELLGPGQFGL